MPVSNGGRRRLTPIRLVIATVMVMAIGFTAAGCIFGRRSDAEDLDRHVRAMPGVADTDMTYHNTFTSGERFDLNVTLQQDITEPQIRDIGKFFANRTDATGLADRSAELFLRLPVVPPPSPKNLYARDYQLASFSRGPYNTAHSPNGGQIADAAAAWLRMARSPIVADASLTAPTWGGAGDSRSVTITLKPTATQTEALALQVGEPMLSDANWGISIQDDPTSRPHDYFASPRPPSDDDLRTWREISVLIGSYYEATAQTNVPAAAGQQADTVVKFAIATDAGSQPQARRIAFGVPTLLQRLGRAVAVTIWTVDGGAEFLVGGCYQHDAKHHRLPLEIELSATFEKC
ncbi:hypothetical protein FZI85_27240 [Mycobacterium sp. CBMA293]|uniref:Uncharacterized protein n=1 Tax=Mycolicibacterium sp. CBMA 213 TaxID=1968788 RepID=A0A1S6GKL4_9MYCO|nr:MULTISPECIES: hypothetical protein [unclassified Mycolicibacterium]AQS22382.1 hypothetical protein pCBMA213_2_00018 [Mycolicibacterium sp. CBMA 213]MUL48443.1 hypothetical protein [Mycolicibacterium sp. CBMA 360]MUL62301.1 hypothetical protein [Mycolicibacterium sp. CBMA 335]MUM14701.1 hypothetical protein [Mycolicibacterium sp. CBMA 293]